MAAPIPEQNPALDFAGTTRSPDRDRRMHQDIFDNSLIELKENDFSSLLLRQLPNPVVNQPADSKPADFVHSADQQAGKQVAIRPDPATPERRLDDRADTQDYSAASSAATNRSGDDLPLDEPRQASQETVSRSTDAEDQAPADNGVTSGLPLEGMDADATDDTEPTADANELPMEEGQSGQNGAKQHADSLSPMAANDSENLVGNGIRSEQEKITNSTKTNGIADGQSTGSPALLAGAEAESGEGDPGESMPGFSRNNPNSVSGAGLDNGGEGDPEVTREFKELSKSATFNQVVPANAATVNTSQHPEKSELQRLALLESGLKDKAAVTPAHAVGMRTAAAMTPSSSPYVTNIPAQVQSPEWQQGVVEKLLWFVSEKIQSAQIHVNPPELGPVDMKIQVSKDQAQVQIQSPHAVVRDLLEGTAIRLREMLANQGIELTSFNVESQGEQTNQQGDSRQSSESAGAGSESSLEPETNVAVQSDGVDQLVDYYV